MKPSPIDDMNKVLNVNLLGVSNSIGAVLPGMIERRRGHLVGISSVASYRGLPRMLAYSASKAAVAALTRSLAIEWGPRGVNVNAIHPGATDTERFGELLDQRSRASGKSTHFCNAWAPPKPRSTPSLPGICCPNPAIRPTITAKPPSQPPLLLWMRMAFSTL